ncbi:MAG: DHA2 family efflux MFS transporter permease subunit [Sphingomonadales bacterium]|nr:DHA2 family efflux MFS transporter permease subunit [Sphingomonadales bacterium]
MAAGTLVSLDMTIANVALPHMQATFAAGPEEIVWVLTSYLVATAIAMPLGGWLATRFGRKRTMLAATLGFTIASFACGAANSLGFMVFARLAQGFFGAGLIPLAQATLVDINPPERTARAMALFGVGTMVGPLFGPTIGGWLTDSFTWRWVFFINVPVGLIALTGLWFSEAEHHRTVAQRFDMFGFITLSLAIGAFQLVLDRGQQLDWFSSTEICIEAGVAVVALWIAVVHMLTTSAPFITPSLFKDRNLTLGLVLSAAMGLVSFAIMPIIVVMQQQLLGWSPLFSGIVGFPRGAGMIISLILVGRMVPIIGPRVSLASGLAVVSWSLFLQADIDLSVDARTMAIYGFVQGFGTGLIFVPLSVIVFATLPPALRTEGAVMYSFTRNIGSSIGVSMLQTQLIQRMAAARSGLVEHVRPDAPLVQWRLPDLDFGVTADLARISGMVMRQASMLAYVSLYQFVGWLLIVMIPLLFLLRPPAPRPAAEPLPIVD